MDLKLVIWTFIMCLTGFIGTAQDSIQSIVQDSLKPVVYDQENEYIHIYKNRITGRIFFVNTSNTINVNDRNSDVSFKLTPNKQDRIGASVSFRALTISYSFAPDFLAENKDNGDSKLFNLGFRTYFGKHWMQTLDIYNEKGFFAVNNNLSIPFPEFKSFKIGGATSFIFNENLSFRAIVSQDEKQIKSAGSFIPRIVYYYTKFNLKTDSVDEVLNSFDIVFAPSYYYNFVPTKNLFISTGVSAGLGLNHSRNKDNNLIKPDENLTSLVTEFNVRGSLTYDISDFYIGAHYNYLILNHNTDRSSYVNDAIPYFQIFAGYRFKASQKMVNKADHINEKLNLN
jgi:hypothetical protein